MSRGLWLNRLLIALIVTNLIVFAAQRFIAVPLTVFSTSMTPTLRPGDRVLAKHALNKSSLIERVERGDLVYFRDPNGSLIVKRVIALPREIIEAHHGVIALDNTEILEEPWLNQRKKERSFEIEQTHLKPDELFVLGDNRANSVDSRDFGPINLTQIVGVEGYRIWPLSRAGSVNP